MTVLRLKGLSKRFAGVVAVDGADLDVPAGQRHAIIGPNGAGKSTLLALVAGTLRPTNGRVEILGTDVTSWRPHRIARLGVSRTFQHSGRFGEETVLDNCLLAAHATSSAARTIVGRDRQLRHAACEALEAVDLGHRSGDLAAELSHGEARQLEIAMALAQRPRLLLADEPLAGLSETERIRIGGLLRGLERDVTVVFIEHDLEFVLDVADEVTVLHLGSPIASGPPAAIRADERVSEVYLGGAAVTDAHLAGGRPANGQVMLAVEGLCAGYGDTQVLDDISLDADAGRVLAVLGRNGMGKSTLLKTIMGTIRASAGTTWLDGVDVSGQGAARRARAGIALVPQGRGILPGLTVAEQLTVGHRPGRWTERRVYDLFPILEERRQQIATTLSGGEQQMLAIGRALLRNPAVLLLDEPSEGLAPAIIAQVAEIVAQLASEGETIVLAEQNAHMALAIADDVAILDRGRIVFRGPAPELRDDSTRQLELLGL